MTSDDSADKTWKRSQDGLGTKSYTLQEDKDIVQFLISTQMFSLVKGTDVWKSMAIRVKKPRSWQSLKNRFLRYIVPNLDDYHFPPDICNKIRQGLERKPVVGTKPTREALALNQLDHQNNLAPLSSQSNRLSRDNDLDPMDDLRSSTNKGNKRLLASPSSTPYNTSQRGSFVAKKFKLENCSTDTPISASLPDKTNSLGSQSQKQVDSWPLSQDTNFLNPVVGSKSYGNQVLLASSHKSSKPEVALAYKCEADNKVGNSDHTIRTTALRRDPFRPEEDVQILRFIADSGRYADVKGNTLWEFIEKKCPKVCPGRTSQSLKERFRKRIIPKIDSFEQSKDLTKAEIERFKEYSSCLVKTKSQGPLKI